AAAKTRPVQFRLGPANANTLVAMIGDPLSPVFLFPEQFRQVAPVSFLGAPDARRNISLRRRPRAVRGRRATGVRGAAQPFVLLGGEQDVSPIGRRIDHPDWPPACSASACRCSSLSLGVMGSPPRPDYNARAG